MENPIIYGILVFLAIYIGLCFIAYAIQSFFFFHPEKLPESFQFISKYDIPMNKIFIEVGDGSRINALHYQIPDAKGVVFYFKGNTKSIKGWGKFSKDFVSKGYDFFMIDYPGFGKSKGKRTEARIYNIAQFSYKWLCERYPEEKIIIYGRSMGSGFAARIASWNRPRMLIMDSGFYSFYHLAQRYVPLLPMKWIIRYKIPTYEFIRSINCPVFFIHGNKDWVIPYKHSVWMNKEIPERSKLFTIEGGKHNNLPSIAKYHEVLDETLNSEELFKQYDPKVEFKLRKVVYITLGTVLLLVIIGNVFTYPMQHLFLFRPEVLDQNHQFTFKNSFEELNLQTKDGGNINALHFKNPDSKGVVLYFHGNVGNLIRWGELNDEFRKFGYDLFIMDYRSFGKSTGKMTEALFYQDAEQCYEYVSEYYQADQIIIYGRSMGSGPASYLASKVEAQHLILETPFYSIQNLFYTYYPFLPPVFYFKYRFPNFDFLKKVSYPVTIFHGTNDFVVPHKGSKKLAGVIKESDEFVSIKGGTHNDLFIFHQYQEKLAEILK